MKIEIRNGKVVLPKNAKQIPKVYYGLHMAEGVAEYEENGEPSRIFISNEAINKMHPTFEGKPVFVEHQDTDMDNLQEQADGYVINSFFNKTDGRHWVKFIVVSDRGHQAIQNGWTLSNCYEIDSSGSGGRWHNVEYDQEVTAGEFDHLAIVQNPRYEESVILTPEEFRNHNAKKESELSVLYNSKRKGESVGFKLWTKKKVENTDELAGAVVELEDGSETTIADMIKLVSNTKKETEAAAAKKKTKNEVSKDEKVKVGDTEMTVGELIAAYQDAIKKHTTTEDSAENESDDDSESDEDKRRRREREKMASKKESASNEETAENESDDDDDDDEKRKAKKSNVKKEKQARADQLRNAGPSKSQVEPMYVDTALDQIERGKVRYGSATVKQAEVEE